MIQLTRRYRFAAAHVLRRTDWGEEANRRAYGQCANPAGHGHDYALEVSVAGPLDRRSGWILPPDRLDALVRERVLDRLDHRLLNDDPWFRDRVPTAENIVTVVHDELARALEGQGGARLIRVRLQETPRNEFEAGEG